MCGRYVLLTDLNKIVASFDVQEVGCDYHPSNTISPGQQIPAVVRQNEANHLVFFRWGLIPSWAKDPSIGNKMFNARAETVAEKPSFRSAFKRRRCLIIADGFYEWQKLERVKKPFLFFLRAGEPFGFAGLYEIWISPDGSPVQSCTIITTTPNDLISPIHDRMPVILHKDQELRWMDPSNEDQKGLLNLLKPYPADEMEGKEVAARDLYTQPR